MSLVKAKELKELSQDELDQRLAKLRKEQYELVQKKEVGQLDRPHRFRHIRREIGQILTVANQNRAAKASAPAAKK
jgi:large subunit ribosomal protein L29